MGSCHPRRTGRLSSEPPTNLNPLSRFIAAVVEMTWLSEAMICSSSELRAQPNLPFSSLPRSIVCARAAIASVSSISKS